MNQKVKTGQGITIVIIIAATFAFFTWKWQQNNQKTKTVQTPTASINQEISKSTQLQQTTNNLNKSESIENQGNKITLNLPQSWGNLVIPQTNEFGHVISDNPYRSKADDNDTILFGGVMGENESSKMISNYTYGKEYDEVPTISLGTYPATFADDDMEEGESGFLTKKQKEENFQPLLDVFKNGNINNVNLSQKCFANDLGCSNLNLIGFWWGNIDCISDRISVHYYENLNSDLRGIGYFSVAGQDMPGKIESYKVILINPQKRILVYLYLPIDGLYSHFTDNELPKEYIKKAYDYLENPENYKNTQLEKFMNEVQNTVSSIKIIS